MKFIIPRCKCILLVSKTVHFLREEFNISAAKLDDRKYFNKCKDLENPLAGISEDNCSVLIVYIRAGWFRLCLQRLGSQRNVVHSATQEVIMIYEC